MKKKVSEANVQAGKDVEAVDRLKDQLEEWKNKYAALEADMETAVANAAAAAAKVRQCLWTLPVYHLQKTSIYNQSPKGIKMVSDSLALLSYYSHEVIFHYFAKKYNNTQ